METNKLSTLIAGLLIGGALIGGIVYFAMGNKQPTTGGTVSNSPSVTATPIRTTLPVTSPVATTTPLPIATTTPTSTPTPTPTTESYVSKTIVIKGIDPPITPDTEIKLEIPQGAEIIKITKTPAQVYNGYIVRKGTKNYMMFNMPYELYERQTYYSATSVSSSTIANLKRVRSKKVYSSSGDYQFAVTYVTASQLLSGTNCTGEAQADSVASPCVSPSLTYGSSGEWIQVFCSIDATYQQYCDRTMKTIKFRQL